MAVPSGVVKWFDPDRGMGAIAPDGGGLDAVVHRSAIHGDADRTMVAGQQVCFDLTQDTAGVRADNIQPPNRLCCPSAEAVDGEPDARPHDGPLVWMVPPGLLPRPAPVHG